MALAQSDDASAVAFYEESLGIGREIGVRKGIAATLAGLASLVYSQGDFVSAKAFLEESLTLYREIDNQEGIAFSLEAFAALAAKQGQMRHAARLWRHAEVIQAQIGVRLPMPEQAVYKRDITLARKTMGEAMFSEPEDAMTLEQAIEAALQFGSHGQWRW